MAARASKVNEFYAHRGAVNCASLGPKSCQVLVTGGDDCKVALWTVGKERPIVTLSGHTKPVDSAVFDDSEAYVLAGARSGSIRLWRIDSQKVARHFSGHLSSVRALDLHPFGDFFASGAEDTNLKIWDIRQRNCIQTHKSHGAPVTVVKHSPDGKWIVSGDEQGAVKLWDIAAGKLLKQFQKPAHEAITDIAFSPHELLLGVGSASRTVDFWDLENWEIISSTDLSATSVQKVMFLGDDKTSAALVASQDSLKVWGWEPSCLHDELDVRWGNLTDMAITPRDQLVGVSCKDAVCSVFCIDQAMASLRPFAPPARAQAMSRPSTSSKVRDLSAQHAPQITAHGAKHSLTSSTDFTQVAKQINPPSPSRGSNPNHPTATKNNVVSTGISTTTPDSANHHEPIVTTTATNNVTTRAAVVRHSTDGATAIQGLSLGDTPQPRPQPKSQPSQSRPQTAANTTNGLIANQLPGNRYSQPTAKEPGSSQKTSKASAGLPDWCQSGAPTTTTTNSQKKQPAIASRSTASRNQPRSTHTTTNHANNHRAPQPAVVSRQAPLKRTPPPQAQANMLDMTVIPSQSDKPIGLDIGAFLSGGQSAAEIAAVPDASQFAKEVGKSHQGMRAVLQKRPNQLKLLRSFWAQNKIRALLEECHRVEKSTLIDFMSSSEEAFAKDLLNLDTSLKMLPLLKAILDNKYEHYLLTGVRHCLAILNGFSGLVRDTRRNAQSASGVDISHEERLAKCNRFYQAFADLRPKLEPLTRKPSELGALSKKVVALVDSLS